MKQLKQLVFAAARRVYRQAAAADKFAACAAGLLLGLFFLFFSCVSPYSADSDAGFDPEKTVFQSVNELFVKSDNDEHLTRFFTNDPKYHGPNGFTLWTAGMEEDGELDREVIVSKSSGNNSAGYGLVICHKMRESEGTEKLVMLTVMINNRGQYAVGKVEDAAYKEIKPWTLANLGGQGNYLRMGSGQENKIRVAYSGDNYYDLYVNGEKIDAFTEEAPFCEGKGQSGYVVVVAPGDSAVDVLFWE
jgi:hypothetical protein